MRTLLRPVILFSCSLALFVAGCGGGGGGGQVQSISVAIDAPKTVTVAASATHQFQATVTGTSNTAVTWTVMEASGGSVNASGLYTAPGTPGTYHVVATSQADSSKSDTATATVEAGNPGISVTIDAPRTVTVAASATHQFQPRLPAHPTRL